MRTSTLRGVKREGVWLRVLKRHARSRAHQVARVVAHTIIAIVVQRHCTLALVHSIANRAHHTLTHIFTHDQAVDNKLYRVCFIAVKTLSGRELADCTVNTGIDISAL